MKISELYKDDQEMFPEVIKAWCRKTDINNKI